MAFQVNLFNSLVAQTALSTTDPVSTNGKWYLIGTTNIPSTMPNFTVNGITSNYPVQSLPITTGSLSLSPDNNVLLDNLDLITTSSYPATLTFRYYIDGTCGDYSDVVVTINEANSAGTINLGGASCIEYCVPNSNMTIDLFDLIDQETIGGTWTSNPANSSDLGLIGSQIIIPTTATPGTYLFEYCITTVFNNPDPAQTCDNCTQCITVPICIYDQPFAGDDTSLTVCI